VRGDVRQGVFSTAAFDAAVWWDMLFHLPRIDHAAAFARVSRTLKPGAPLLFTAAEVDGADDVGVTGAMNGVTFYYYAVLGYRRLIAEHGFVLVRPSRRCRREYVLSRPKLAVSSTRSCRDLGLGEKRASGSW
jgi:hypothetical protein